MFSPAEERAGRAEHPVDALTTQSDYCSASKGRVFGSKANPGPWAGSTGRSGAAPKLSDTHGTGDKTPTSCSCRSPTPEKSNGPAFVQVI